MPDFTIQHMQQCKKITAPAHVGGYTQTNLGREDKWPNCTCPAFTYKKTGTTTFGFQTVALPCKHILEAQVMGCTWHQLTGPAQTEDQQKNQVCPKCGGPTEVVRVAV